MSQDSSNLLNRLGPQGRALLTNNSTAYGSPSLPETRLPTQLDFLLNELSNPRPSTTLEKLLSYLAYYYPKIKNPENVRLLTYTVINSPMFSNLKLGNTIKLVDFYTYIVVEKYKISVPTLPFPAFYNSILQGLSSVSLDSRSLPIITGCLNSKIVRDQQFGGVYPVNHTHIGKVDNELLKLFKISMGYNIRALNDLDKNLVMLSFLNGLLNDDVSFYRDLQSSLPVLSKELISLLYGFNSLFPFENLNRLSGLSILYTKLIQAHPDLKVNWKNIEWSLLEIQNFTEQLAKGPYPQIEKQWNDDKSVFFSLIIVFESMVSLMISTNCSLNIRFSKLILQNLLNLSFIIDKIGTGGFESYNFTYLTCLTYLNNDPIGTIQLVEYWFSMIQFGYGLNESSTEQSKLLFILNFIDNEITKQPALSKFMEIINDLIATPINQPILEACHSIKLKHLQNTSTTTTPQQTLWQYIELSISQFPDKLSLNQIKLILESVAKTLSPDISPNSTLERFQQQFLTPLLHQLSTSPNPQTATPQPYYHHKASLCSILLSIMLYVPLAQFIPFLSHLKTNVIDDLVMVTVKEREMLLGELYDGLILTNRYFNQKGEVGFRWWYQELELEDKRFEVVSRGGGSSEEPVVAKL